MRSHLSPPLQGLTDPWKKARVWRFQLMVEIHDRSYQILSLADVLPIVEQLIQLFAYQLVHDVRWLEFVSLVEEGMLHRIPVARVTTK